MVSHEVKVTYPNVCLPMVDVRDVAQAHVLAALHPKYIHRNDRFLMSNKSLFMKQIISILMKN